jgi:hypothetical protein
VTGPAFGVRAARSGVGRAQPSYCRRIEMRTESNLAIALLLAAACSSSSSPGDNPAGAAGTGASGAGGSAASGGGAGGSGVACPVTRAQTPDCKNDPNMQTEPCKKCATDAVGACNAVTCRPQAENLTSCATSKGCFNPDSSLNVACAKQNCDDSMLKQYTNWETCVAGCPRVLACMRGDPACNACGLDAVFGKVWVDAACDTNLGVCIHHYVLIRPDGTLDISYVKYTAKTPVERPWEQAFDVTVSNYRGTWTTDCTYLDMKCTSSAEDRWHWFMSAETFTVATYYRDPATNQWKESAMAYRKYIKFSDDPTQFPVSKTGWSTTCK